MGSRGSVIPFFLKKKDVGIFPLTDTRMTRFNITLEESVNFVLKICGISIGYEIFVPKIPSMRIIDIAKHMVPDTQYEVIGIRPGEKLHEVLITEDDGRSTYELDDRYIIESSLNQAELEEDAYGNASKIQDGFYYDSKSNKDWITNDEFINFLAPLDQ